MSHSILLSINAAISIGNSPNMQKIFSRILLQLNQIPCIQSKYFKKELSTDFLYSRSFWVIWVQSSVRCFEMFQVLSGHLKSLVSQGI